MSTVATPPSSSASTQRNPSRLPRRISLFLVLFIVATWAMWFTGLLEPRPKIALVTANQGPYWDSIIRGAQDAAERYNLRLTVIRNNGDTSAQTAALQGLLGEHYNGIAVSPNDPPNQAAVMAQIANESKLVTFDSDSPVAGKLCFIGTDNYDAGRVLGQQIRQACPDGGEVLICVGTVEKDNGQRRRQGVIDELLQRSYERQRPMDALDAPISDDGPKNTGAKFTIVATLVDGIDPSKAQSLAADAIKKYPNAKAIACLFAYNTPAVLNALKDANKLGRIQVVSFDTNEETLKGIEDGHVAATMLQAPYNIGFEAVRVLGDAARGQAASLPMFQTEFFPCDLVNKSNLETTRQQLAHPRTGGGPTVPVSSPPATAPSTAPAAP